MDKHLNKMLKEVFIINLFVGIIIASIIQTLLKNYGVMWMVGLVIACIGFTLNGLLTYISAAKLKWGAVIVYILNYVIRILVVSLIGFVIYRHNNNSLLAYILGYISNLLGIIIYSLRNSNLVEGK